jgi:hypothetical protein
LKGEEGSSLSKTFLLFFSETDSILILAMVYHRGEHILITNPKFCPLLSTVITPHNVIGSAITDMIDWNDRNVIWCTYALFIHYGSSRVASFILYKLTHVPLNQLFNDLAELKSFLNLTHYAIFISSTKDGNPMDVDGKILFDSS